LAERVLDANASSLALGRYWYTLRGVIPVRNKLTSRTLAAIDALRTRYKREVLREADYWWLDDAV
jgi:hypothetical protein